MTGIVGALLRQFGPTDSLGAGPDTPALSLLDNGDGTTTATITGSSATSSNIVYVFQSGTSAWAMGGTRTGDGTVTLTLTAGLHHAYVLSTLNSQYAPSPVVSFQTVPASITESAPAIAANKLRRMFSLSTTLQAGRSAADTLAASVHLRNVVGDGLTPRPYVVIAPGDTFGYQLASGGARNCLFPAATLFCYLARDTDPAHYDDRVTAEHTALDWFGRVIEDVLELSDADDPDSEYGQCHLPIVAATQITFDETPEERWPDMGRFYWAAWNLDWSWENAG